MLGWDAKWQKAPNCGWHEAENFTIRYMFAYNAIVVHLHIQKKFFLKVGMGEKLTAELQLPGQHQLANSQRTLGRQMQHCSTQASWASSATLLILAMSAKPIACSMTIYVIKRMLV